MMPKIRFRSESAETCWIIAKQLYLAGGILLLLFPPITLLMPTGSVGSFEMQLALLFGYAAVGVILPFYLAAGVVIRCIVSMVTSRNLADENALPEDRNTSQEYRSKVRRIRKIIAAVCLISAFVLCFVPYHTSYFEEGCVQTHAIAYTVIDWHREDAGRDIYFFPQNHSSIGRLWKIRHE